MGLFTKKEGKFDWEKIKDKLNIINEEVNRINPQDISYAYNGYSPLSVKLLEYFLDGGFGHIDGLLKNLPGQHTYP